MASLTRSQLKTSSNNTYDTNGVGGITAAEVRTFNDDLIDSLITNDLTGGMSVATASLALTASSVSNNVLASLNSFTASATIRLNNLESTSASVNVSISNLNAATGSYAISASVAAVDAAQQQQINSLIAASSSYANSASFAASQLVQDGRLNNLESNSASVNVSISNLNSTTASQAISISNLNAATSSYITSAQTSSMTVLSASFALTASYAANANINTASFATTGSNTFRGIQTISSSLTVLGDNTNNINLFRGGAINSDGIAIKSNNIVAYSQQLEISGPSGDAVLKITPSFGGNSNISFDTSAPDLNHDIMSIRGTATDNSASLQILQANQGLIIAEYGPLKQTRLYNKVDISGSLDITGSLSASLNQGYVWVGDANNRTVLVSTSSFGTSIDTSSFATTASFNSYTSSTNVRLNNLESTSASLLVETSNLETFSASALVSISNLNTNSASVNTSISALNVFTASQSTASLVTSITELNTFSASAKVSINALNSATASYVTETESGSFLITASFDNGTRNLTFTKGNNTTFAVNIPDISGSNGNFVTTASFNAYTASNDQRVSSLEANSASVNTSIININQFTSSANQRLNAIETVSGSWITESETASFARTNVDNNFTANQTFTNITAVSASFTYVQTLYETSSVIYSSGSNQFGDELTDIQTLSGSVKVQGSLTVNGIPVLTSSVDISGLTTTASFNSYTQSNDQRVGSLEAATGSYATTGSNTFIGNQTVKGDVLISGSSDLTNNNHLNFTRYNGGGDIFRIGVSDNGNTYDFTITGSTNQQMWLIDNQGGTYINTFQAPIIAANNVRLDGGFTASLQNGYAWVGNASGKNSQVPTSSFSGGGSINTGSFATTGSNTFIGNQTISKNGGQFEVADPTNPQYGTASFGISGASGGIIVKQSGSTIVEGNAGSQNLSFYGTASFNKGIKISDSDITNGVDLLYNTTTNVLSISRQGADSASLNIEGTFTSSLQQGYVWVGDASNRTALVATSSFAGGGSINTGSFATTGSNAFSGSNTFNGNFNIITSANVDNIIISASADNNNDRKILSVLNNSELFPNSGSNFSYDGIAIGARSGSNPSAAVAEFAVDYNNGPSLFWTPNRGDSANTNRIRFTNLNNVTQSVQISTGLFQLYNNGSRNIADLGKVISFPIVPGTNGQYLRLVDSNGTVGFSTFDSGSFATTGSNTFRGIETFEDAGGNATSLVPVSGSLILVAKGYTSASAHLTSSANSFVNLIFKDSNLTTDTIISGSNNIFSNPAAPTANFKRYIGSNNIFIPSGSVPQITGSTAYPLTINNNFSNGGNISVVGPVSASASTISNNLLGGQGGIAVGTAGANNAEKLVGGFSIQSNVLMNTTQTIIANQSAITGSTTFTNNQCVAATTIAVSSSAVNLGGNLLNTLTNNIRNAYWSSSIGLGQLSVARNIFIGSNHTTLFTGSLPAGVTNQPQIAESQLMGTNLTAFVDVAAADVAGTTANHSILSTMIHGHNTIVTGSSANTANNFGSAFFGRFNAQDGNRSKTAQTIFAVGTGTSGGRKTGFLIDSASNAFVEGSLSVSGSTLANALNVTGSVDVSGSTTLRGNVTQTTGSLTVFGNIRTTNGVFTSSIDGGLYIDNIGYVGSGSAGAYFIGTTTQDLKIQNWYSSSVDGKNIVIENFSPTGSTPIFGKVALRARGVGGAVTVENTSQFRVECDSYITGSLTISSSAATDLIITGAAKVSSQNALQTNTIGPNTFNIDTTRDASVNAENYIFGSTASVSSIYVGVYDSPAFNTDVELKLSADSGGISFNDWDNVDGAYESWLTLDANVGNNPIPTFTRGLNVTGSTTLSGSLYIQSGSTLPVSTGSAILTWDAATGQVKQASYSTIISASVSSAEFWSTTTQSGSAGVSGSITFNNSGSFYNVSLVNGKELKVANAGVYNIQFSAQIETSAGADTIYLWFKKNGNNIGASASKAVLANNTAQIMTVNILDEAAANDYYEIAYQNVNGHATVLAEAASGNIPAIPSVIATIIQVR